MRKNDLNAQRRLCKIQQKTLPFSEEQLLKGLNAKTSHADELAWISDKELKKRS